MLLRALTRFAGPEGPNVGPGEVFQCGDVQGAAYIQQGYAVQAEGEEAAPKGKAAKDAGLTEPAKEGEGKEGEEGGKARHKGSKFA